MAGDRRLEMLALYELGNDVPVQCRLPISYNISNLENGLRIAQSLGDRASEANMLSQLAVIAANRLHLDAALDYGLRGWLPGARPRTTMPWRRAWTGSSSPTSASAISAA